MCTIFLRLPPPRQPRPAAASIRSPSRSASPPIKANEATSRPCHVSKAHNDIVLLCFAALDKRRDRSPRKHANHGRAWSCWSCSDKLERESGVCAFQALVKTLMTPETLAMGLSRASALQLCPARAVAKRECNSERNCKRNCKCNAR